MKEIGIVTFHRPYNYGANLQAFALQEKLNELGYEAKLIDYRNKQLEESAKAIQTNFKGKSLKRILKEIMANIYFLPKNILRGNSFKEFQKKYYKLSNVYYTKGEIENSKEKFDIYISGSDQIWNSNITKGIDPVYTLNLNINNIKRISYASSMGNAQFSNKEDVEKLIKNLKQYDHLAVREQAGKEFLKQYLNNEIEVVLDPTLLLSKEEWLSVAKELKTKEEYILFYTVKENEDIFKITNKLSEITNLKIITFRRTNGKLKNVLENRYTKGPSEFIETFKNAKYIITSSFHGTVFSILFNKPFFVNYGGKENKRIESLLKVLGIDNRLIGKEEELTEEKIKSKIDYKKVNEILEREREKSIKYLKGAINNE